MGKSQRLKPFGSGLFVKVDAKIFVGMSGFF
jgi:hypothetical protein